MFRHLTLAGLALSIAMTAMPAFAANCAKRDALVTKLQSKYSEQLTAGGMHSTRTTTAMVEVWSSPKTGTFTVMLTNAHGVSCIVASGTDWFADAPVKTPEGTAS